MARSLPWAAAVAVLFVLLAATVATGAGSVVRAALALPFVLGLPGFCVSLALLPGRHVEIAERLVLSLGLSIAITLIGGVLLNLTPWGLQAASWAILLGAVTVGASLVALVRRYRCVTPRSGIGRHVLLSPTAAVGVALALLIGAAAVAIIAAAQAPSGDFTELWLLSAGDAHQPVVRVGVRNMDRVARAYELSLQQEGTVIREWPTIVLQPGQEWETTAQVSAANQADEGQPVEALLLRPEAPLTIFRYATWHPAS